MLKPPKTMYITMHVCTTTTLKKYGPAADGTKPAQFAIIIIGNFFKGLGILLHRKLIDVNLVKDCFPVKIAWEKLEPIIKGFRKQYKWFDWLEHFEYLHNEMQKRELGLSRKVA